MGFFGVVLWTGCVLHRKLPFLNFEAWPFFAKWLLACPYFCLLDCLYEFVSSKP